MSPEAEVAFEQELGVDPATLTIESVEPGKTYKISGDAKYQEYLERGAAVYWLLIEAKVLDQRKVLTYWQLSALEQQPYIKLGQLMDADVLRRTEALRSSFAEDYEMEFCCEHGVTPATLADMHDELCKKHEALERTRREDAQRIAELETQLGLRAGTNALDALERAADEG